MVRALVVTPLALVGSLLVTLLSPVLHLLLAIIDIFDRKNWRFTRVVGLGIAFCVVELFGLVSAFVLWVIGGLGLWIRTEPIQRMHLWVLSTWLELITRAITTFIGFRFVFPDEEFEPGPLLVFSRHAGPGDALLVARSLMRDHGRRLRMLGTTKLLWDPFFNHLVNRLPFYFCEQNPSKPEQELSEVRRAAATIEPDGVMIVFPEGENFTPKRRDEAIERLQTRGQGDRAERARRLHHVLPPRTGGTIAAMEAAPNANLVFLAHVGLDDLLSLGDIWRNVPIKRTVRAGYWYADRTTQPSERGEMVDWLYEQWQAVDDWIEDNAAAAFGH